MSHLARPLFALFLRALRVDVRAKFPTILRAVLLSLLLALLLLLQFLPGFRDAAGKFLLGYLSALNFLGITLLGLATFASAITEEKEEETLGLLRLTRLNPLSILLGKSTARFAGGLLLLAVQIPFAMLCATLGGVSIAQILEVYAVLGANLFFLCNLGLLASVLSRTTTVAITATLVASVILFVIPLWIWFAKYSSRASVHDFGAIIKTLATVNPILHLSHATVGRAPWTFTPHSIGPLLIGGAICFSAAWLFFERFCAADPQPARQARKTRLAHDRARQDISRAWRRALAWKDFYFSAGGVRGALWRFGLYALLTCIVFATRASRRQELWIALSTSLHTVASYGFPLELALAASSIFGRERRQQTLGSIWILPLKTGRWLWQKIAGYSLALLPGALAYFGSQVLSVCVALHRHDDASDSSPWLSHILLGQIYTVLLLLFIASFIAYLSLRMRRGALLAGLLAIMLWHFVFFTISTAFIFRFRSMGEYYSQQATLYGTISLVLVVLTSLLLFLIPRRLATCAAEE